MTELLRPAQWLIAAERDLTTAELVAQGLPELAAQVAFHAQQCAERALKAVLMEREADMPRSHAIEELLDLASAAGAVVPAHLADATLLTAYAVELRYAAPDTVTGEEAREAIRMARTVLAWARAETAHP